MADPHQPTHQQAAADAERRCADVQRLAGVGAWEWNVATGELWCSDEMYRLLELDPAGPEIDFQAYLALIHPAQRDEVREGLAALLRGQDVAEFRHRVILPQGGERALFGRAEVERGEDGRARRVMAVARDVTEERRLQRALRQSQERLSLFLDRVPAMLWSTDADLRLRFGRGAGLRAAGLDDQRIQGMSLEACFGGERCSARHLRAHREALEGQASSYEMEWAGRLFQTRVEPFRSEEGEIIGALGVALDVTVPRQAALALEESERLFRSLIEKVHDVITVLAEDGAILYESPSVRTALGYQQDERIGRSAFEFLHPDDVPEVQAAFARALESPGGRQSASMRIRHRDGGWRHFEVVGTNLLHDPAIGGVVINSRDVTERALLEGQLRQAQRLESVGKLAGGIAHDFNNLLTVIQGNAQLLLTDLPQSTPLRADVEEIDAASRRAAELTQQLLVFSRREIRSPQLVDVNTVLQEMEGILRRLVRENVTLVTHRGEALAPVRADPGHLHQVLTNLVMNAREAMPNGGRLTLTTRNTVFPRGSAREDAPAVLLSVEDSGVGMSAEVRERAFEPFFTTKEAGEGTGLGLSAVYGIVEESGGFTCIRSEPGAGTTVDVYLPAASAPAAEGHPGPTAEPPGGATILLVEDEDAVRAIARKALERAGYRVFAMESGADALRLVAERGDEVDLVVSDVVMPRMSGPEMVARIHRTHPDLRVLYISGYTEEAVVRRGIAEGTAELLAKPFSPVDLVRRVAQLLDS